MDDDDGIYNETSQIIPSYILNNVAIYNTNTTQPITDYGKLIDNDHVSSSTFIFQETNNQYTCNTSIRTQCPTQEDIIYEKINDQLSDRKCRIEIAEVPDEQNESDEHCLPVRLDRRSRTSESSNYDRAQKLTTEIIDKQVAYFPHKYGSLSTDWYLYRIKISNNNDLGFIVPCKLIQLPKFNIYENENDLTVQILYIGPVDYKKCENQLKDFCRYLFEDAIPDMNTGLNLKFDLEHSTFKLLPCFLKQSDELDYQRMALICNRKNKLIQNPFELNDQEVYMHLNLKDKRLYMTVTTAPLPNSPTVAMKCIERPSICYLKKSPSVTNKELNSPTTKLYNYSIRTLRYAPLNYTDFQLIYKIPSILLRISQLYYVEQFRQFLANKIQSSSLVDVDQMPIVTFCDCLLSILSSSQSTVLPLVNLNYDLLSKNDYELQPSSDLIFQAITCASALENSNLESLETLGDCFLKLAVSLSLYHRYPLDDTGKLTTKRSDEVSNKKLYRISDEKGLKRYLNTIQPVFYGKNANWIPPGFIVDEKNAERYIKQKSKWDVFSDMIEALIGAFLISTNPLTTLEFMKLLDLDVIPIDKHDGMVKMPSILRINQANDLIEIEQLIQKTYNEHSLIEIERKINYHFKDKAYLIAAFTHPSCSDRAITINYTRLKFVGNALLEFLITRHIFLIKKSITPGHITNVRQDLLYGNRKATIMVRNDLHTKIICSSRKLIEPIVLNTTDTNFFIDENNDNQLADLIIPSAVADVFEALVGAIFLDSGYSLKTVWDVIYPLFRQYTNLDDSIEHPNLNSVRLVCEHRGVFTDELKDENGNFVFNLKLPDGTEGKGSGKSKKLARQSACKKVKK